MCLNTRAQMRPIDLDQIVHRRTEEVRAAHDPAQSVSRTREHDIRRAEPCRPMIGISLRQLSIDALRAVTDKEKVLLTPYRKEVRNPHEVKHKGIRSLLKDLPRRTDLLNAAVLIHDRYAVRNREPDLLIVRHIEDSDIQLLLQGLDLKAHLLTQIGIQIRQRLIEEQERGLADKRTRERDALLLAARELRRQTFFQPLHPDDLHHLHHARTDLVLWTLRDLERVGNIVKDRHVWPYRIVLKDEPDAAALRRYLHLLCGVGNECIVQIDPARIRGLKPCNQAKQHCFPTARRPKQGKALSLAYRQ